MTALVSPDVDRWQSWAAMVEDFGSVDEMHGSGYWNLAGAPVATQAGCVGFVTMTELTAPADVDGLRVASTYFWIAAGDGAPDDELVGFLHLRHGLNDHLLEHAGHIGYSVRPSARGRGHATAALELGLLEAGRREIDEALLICESGNEASRRTIENALARRGGRREEPRHDKLRYWLQVTGQESASA